MSDLELPNNDDMDTAGLATLNEEERLAALDLVDKLRRRAATLKRRRKIKTRRMKEHLEDQSIDEHDLIVGDA